MGELREYFVAAPADITPTLIDVGPEAAGVAHVIGGKGYDVAVALGMLGEQLTGRPWTEIGESRAHWSAGRAADPAAVPADWWTENSEVHASGPTVEQVGDELRDALAAVDPASWSAVAARWVASEELDGTDPADAAAWLALLGDLARAARRDGHHLYCWSCL